MVELAFVLILLMMLLVGTVSAAIAFGRGNSIQNAVREASRFAATLDDVQSQLAVVIDVAQAAASGDLDSTVPGFFACAAYIPGTPLAATRLTEGSPPALFMDVCYDDERPADERRIQVFAGRTTDFNVVIFSLDIDLAYEAAARYERE
jgi:hypothetical protein